MFTKQQLIDYDFSNSIHSSSELIQAWIQQKQHNLFRTVPIQGNHQSPATIMTRSSEITSLELKDVTFVQVEGNLVEAIQYAKQTAPFILFAHDILQLQQLSILAYLLSTLGSVVVFYAVFSGEIPQPILNLEKQSQLVADYIKARSFHNFNQIIEFAKEHELFTDYFHLVGQQQDVTVHFGVETINAERASLQVVVYSPWQADEFSKYQSKNLYYAHPSLFQHLMNPSHILQEEKTTSVPVLHNDETEFSKIIESVFRKDLSLFHSKGSSNVSYGHILSTMHRFELFIQSVRDSMVSVADTATKELLEKWIHAVENHDFKGVPSLQSHLSHLPKHLQEQQDLFDYKSIWLVDNGSLLEIGNTLIHTILSSNENINILIADTNPYDGINEEYKHRRDVGLYALNYGNAYSASICPAYSYSQAVQAITEADKFNGPSVIILHSPRKQNSDPIHILSNAKKIIDEGIISLYRWTPEKNGTPSSLLVDSTKPKASISKFLEKNANLSLVLSEKEQEEMTGHMDKIVLEKLKESYFKLFGSMKKTRLLILFGSDGGNAESLSKRIGLEAKEKGLFVKTMAMDSFVTEDLQFEEHVLFVVSTAGQGEFPGNARETWKILNSTPLDLSKMKYSVMALGDRHYWPRPEDAHYFAKSGKDLDAKLRILGANQLTNIGIGDDRDPDGFYTGYNSWAPGFWASLGVETEAIDSGAKAPTDDAIKAASNYLRGTIATSLLDESTGALAEYDTKLTKFHGIYQQDNRDIREHRARKGLEKAFSFMIRVRVPGGIATPAQYLAMDEISDKWANGTIKITTRQAFQFHGILKSVLKKSMQDINRSLLDTIAACGDVNRNVMCNPNPGSSKVHQIVLDFSRKLSAHLTPATSAYHEIWLDKKLVAGGDDEPLYGKTYLPRKFKVAVAVPPSNDVDVLAHDLGYIAIVENGEFKGFNVTVGGGMGQTHGNNKTYPVLAKPLCFVTLDKAIDVGEKVMLVQRDFGNRTNRKHARLKYTIEDHGIEWFRSEVEKRCGYQLLPSKEYQFTSNGDRYGWHKHEDGTWSFTLFIQNGRIKDTPDYLLKTGLREIAKALKGEFALTPNQHLLIGKISETDKPVISDLLTRYKINNNGLSGLRLNSMACVALPTCALAMAESERYLPSLIDKIDSILEKSGLRDDEISIRMTGCPNGCARPAIAEIGFIGKAPGMYNMYLGGGFNGERLNKLYKESIGEDEILKSLQVIIGDYALSRLQGEHFGDFCIRKNIV